MSVHLSEAAELVSKAAASPGLLVNAPHVVLSPTYQALWKRVVDDGEIGAVLTARARYGWSGPTWGRWYYDTGGGPLFDLGVCNITSLTGLMGSVQRVAALAGTAVPRREVDGETIEVKNFDNYQVLLDFGDARFAVVTTGFTMHEYRSPAIELYGTGGVAQMLGDDWAPQGYEIVRADSAGWTTYAEVDPAWPWTAGLRHLVDCVLDDAELLVRPEHAYHCLEVMVKAQLAAASGETQEVSSRIGRCRTTPTPSMSSAAAKRVTTTASAATETTRETHREVRSPSNTAARRTPEGRYDAPQQIPSRARPYVRSD